MVATAVILTFMTLAKLRAETPGNKQVYLSLDLAGASAGTSLGRLHDIIGKHARSCDLRRYDTRDQGLEVTYAVDLRGVPTLARLPPGVEEREPGRFLSSGRSPSPSRGISRRPLSYAGKNCGR